jgi:14-3-3 protein
MIGQKLNKYKKKIETELVDLCRGLIKIVDENLLMNSKHPENMIYYTKMKADYMRYAFFYSYRLFIYVFRYLAEFLEDAECTEIVQNAL